MNFVKMMTSQGVPIYACCVPSMKSVSLYAVIKAGTCDEIWPKEAGLAHAMEHMVFRGTEDFANSQKLSAYIENTGGWINASTSKAWTCFKSCVPLIHIEKSVHFLSQMIRKPLFRAEDISLEMKAVVQEIRRRNDDPRTLLINKYTREIFDKNPLGLDTLGIEDSVLHFKTADFQKWQNKFYHPGNLTFFVIGNFKEDEIKKLLEKYFPENILLENNQRTIAPIKAVKKYKHFYKDIEQAHLVFGALTPECNHPDHWPLEVFESMICGGSSSPLFQEVRDKRGLAYTAYACHWIYNGVSLFMTYIGTDPKKVKEVLKVSLEEVITKSRGSSSLMDVAKEMMIGQLTLSSDSPQKALGMTLDDINVANKITTLEEKIEKIQSVTIQQVSQAVEKYLLDENRRVTVILGPKDK